MIDASWTFYTQAERDAWHVYLSDRQAKDVHGPRVVGFHPEDHGQNARTSACTDDPAYEGVLGDQLTVSTWACSISCQTS